MPYLYRSIVVTALLAASSLPGGAFAQAVSLGSEFRINTYTPQSQERPAIAANGDGTFVIAWTSTLQDGGGRGVFARRFNSLGAPLGAEFQVNTLTIDGQQNPAIGIDDDGDFVIAWESWGQDGSAYGIVARRFSAAGGALASEFLVNLLTSDNQTDAAVGMEHDGDFVIAWESVGVPASRVYARRWSSAGTALGTAFLVNTNTSLNNGNPALGVADDGDFVVAWSAVMDGDQSGVFVRRFDASGQVLGSELQVNAYTTGQQLTPSVGVDGDGDFVVAWASFGQDGSGSGVFARRFSSAGAGVGGELQVNLFTDSSQRDPTVAMRDGRFVVAWGSYGQEAAGDEGIVARRFNTLGVPVGGELRVNTHTVDDQKLPVLTLSDNGRFVVAWESTLQDGSAGGIFNQRFATPGPTLDVDANGSIAALTDGLLILRFLFGLTDEVLVTGVVDLVGCSRCTPAQIEFYLDNLAGLDVDGDGEQLALTDGLLCVRFFFGLRGEALVGGAVDEVNCTRCTGPQVESYLSPLL